MSENETGGPIDLGFVIESKKKDREALRREIEKQALQAREAARADAQARNRQRVKERLAQNGQSSSVPKIDTTPIAEAQAAKKARVKEPVDFTKYKKS